MISRQPTTRRQRVAPAQDRGQHEPDEHDASVSTSAPSAARPRHRPSTTTAAANSTPARAAGCRAGSRRSGRSRGRRVAAGLAEHHGVADGERGDPSTTDTSVTMVVPAAGPSSRRTVSAAQPRSPSPGEAGRGRRSWTAPGGGAGHRRRPGAAPSPGVPCPVVARSATGAYLDGDGARTTRPMRDREPGGHGQEGEEPSTPAPADAVERAAGARARGPRPPRGARPRAAAASAWECQPGPCSTFNVSGIPAADGRLGHART